MDINVEKQETSGDLNAENSECADSGVTLRSDKPDLLLGNGGGLEESIKKRISSIDIDDLPRGLVKQRISQYNQISENVNIQSPTKSSPTNGSPTNGSPNTKKCKRKRSIDVLELLISEEMYTRQTSNVELSEIMENEEVDMPDQPSQNIFFQLLFKMISLKSCTPETNSKIPKPATKKYTAKHQGIIIKLQSRSIQKSYRATFHTAEIQNKFLKTFTDLDHKELSEKINLNHLSSIHKIDVDNIYGETRKIYSFQLNIVGTNSKAGDKFQRFSYVFGSDVKKDQRQFMEEIMKNLTPVFRSIEYKIFGWCYMKTNGEKSNWIGTWLILNVQEIQFHNDSKKDAQIIDLRKVRFIDKLQNDSDSGVSELYVESGPILCIDSPEDTYYFIMSTQTETELWMNYIKEECYKPRNILEKQQLTKDNVPVVLDKMLNFISIYGCGTKEIYIKAGNKENIEKLLESFSRDAFKIQIPLHEYEVNDVCNALIWYLGRFHTTLVGYLSSRLMTAIEKKTQKKKISQYRDVLKLLNTFEYATLKKIIGHLHLLQLFEEYNEISIETISKIWSPILLDSQDFDESDEKIEKERLVIVELIAYYEKIFNFTKEDLKKESSMMEFLTKYHMNLTPLSDPKLKRQIEVYIMYNPNPHATLENKLQSQITITHTTKAIDICREFSFKLGIPTHNLIMMETICDEQLYRPLQYSEKLLNIVLNWAKYSEDDQKQIHLEIRPLDAFMITVQETIESNYSPPDAKILNYADRKTKTLKPQVLEIVGSKVIVKKKEKTSEIIKKMEIKNLFVFIGVELEREFQAKNAWKLTLVEQGNLKRSQSIPFIGHIISGTDEDDKINWFSTLIYHQHGIDFLSEPEITTAL